MITMSASKGGDNLRGDADLLAATREEPEAFGVFYQRHCSNITAYFSCRTHSRDASADLTAETFAAALAGLDRFDPDLGSPSQWLCGIAANQLKQFWRRQRASDQARRQLESATALERTSGWGSITTADARLDGERLIAALRRVPAKSRHAVQLRVFQQLDYNQIADHLGCKPNAARVRVCRGLQRLQTEFDCGQSSPGGQ